MIGRKVIFVVLDGVGIGELPDAPAYGDNGANTIGNIARAVGGLRLPNLENLGLGRIAPVKGIDPRTTVAGCFGKMAEQSRGKDSTTGHWEIAGIITERPFPVYPNGFPNDVIQKFLEVTGSKGVLGNKPASGTEVIKEFGPEHIRTGFPIVYTSSDSVFQIAAHEEIIPLPGLYDLCRKTRQKVMTGVHAVGRVIARPFVGEKGNFSRTPHRRDFSLEPSATTMLDLLSDHKVPTVGIGKIDDLFAGRGLREKIHTKSNQEGIESIIRTASKMEEGFLMANLVDFDMLYGHRQDPEGFAKALTEFDRAVPALIDCLKKDDLLILTADHGNDPTDSSTDHSREYVPLLVYGPSAQRDVDLGIRSTFGDAGKTVAEFFRIQNNLSGTSFLSMVR